MDLQPTLLGVGNVVPTIDSVRAKAGAPWAGSERKASNVVFAPRDAIEILVPDARAELSPAQSVERKLTSMLRGATIPVSHIRLARLCGKR
jgi:hypothetical protein